MLSFAKNAAAEGRHFFYILIREPLGPVERGKKYEDPLIEALGVEGELTGGGSQMGKGDTIEYCGIDVVVNDRAKGLELIRKCLQLCGASANTIIEEYMPGFNEIPL